MLGYKDRPKFNAETIDSEGFMHTGDVVEIDDDGYIYVLDRVKEVRASSNSDYWFRFILKFICAAYQIQWLPGRFGFSFAFLVCII